MNTLLRAWLLSRLWLQEKLGGLRGSRDEKGAVALEYLLIIGIIVIILFTMLYWFMDPVKSMVSMAIQKIKDWTTSAGSYSAG